MEFTTPVALDDVLESIHEAASDEAWIEVREWPGNAVGDHYTFVYVRGEASRRQVQMEARRLLGMPRRGGVSDGGWYEV
jgi:hypothetical protein